MEEVIGSQRSDVDVGIAVVVIIGDGTAESIHFNRESRRFGYVGEGAVFIVVVEGGEGLAGTMAGPIHGVDQQDVLPPVIVVVEEADAAAHGFGEVLFSECAAVVFEVDAGLGGDVGELDGAGGGWL